MKHTIEEARRELSLLSNERNTLRLKVQTMNDQHVEEV
jgi:hypothetical protein